MSDEASIALRCDEGPGRGGKWFGRKKRLRQFIGRPGTEAYLWKQFADGEEQLDRVLEVKQVGRLKGSDTLASVRASDLECSLSYSCMKDAEKSDLDLVVVGRWKISNSRSFLQNFALSRLKSADAVSVLSLEALLAKLCKQAVTDEVKKTTYDALVNRDALPARWWETRLRGWIDLEWLELLEVKEVRYESTSIERAREIKKQEELLELEAAEDAQRKEHELRLEHQKAQFDQAKVDIEKGKELSERERQLEEEKLEQKRQQQALEAALAAEQARMEHEKKKAGIEAEIARLRNDADAAEQIAEKARQAEERAARMMESMQDAQRQLNTSTELVNTFLSSVMAGGASGAGRLGVSAGNVSTDTMALVGQDSGPAYIAQVFREKSLDSPDAVMMRKVELRTRDIGTKEVDELPVNSPLRFEFLSQRAGYVTVLNIGTSGKVWLQAPNVYVGIEEAKVEPDSKSQIPGELLPVEELSSHGLAYVEAGPPGWEELIVIVSDEPLITEADVFRSSKDNPFVELSAERMDQLLDRLSEFPDEGWCAGVLSFLVSAE